MQAELGAAAVQWLAAVGERAGERDARVGRTGEAAPFVQGPQCASFDGFSSRSRSRGATTTAACRMDDYVTKPVRKAVLSDFLDRWLATPASRAAAANPHAAPLGQLGLQGS